MAVNGGSGHGNSLVLAEVDLAGGAADLDSVRRLLLADVYARFRRERGDAVAFAAEIEVADESLMETLRHRCEGLAIGVDWERTTPASSPRAWRQAQELFLELLARDLIQYRPGHDASGSWILRASTCADSCEHGLDDLPGWRPDAVDLQLRALGKIEGVEVEATLLGGPALAAFTPHADAVAEAAFVAVSPRHPQVEAIATPPELEALAEDGKKPPIVQTATQAAVPGVEGLLPVVVSPAVDARFGPTAALGIPARDESDREVAERLEKRPGLPFRATRSSGKARPAARFRLADWPVSGSDAPGPRIPVAHCPDCGPVAAEPDVAATTEDARAEVTCGSCGGPARLDEEKIGGRFIAMWSWLIACLPPELESRALSAPELEQGVPVQMVVWGEADVQRILDKRVAAKLAAALGELSWLDPPEPFRAARVCGSVRHADDDMAAEAGDLDRLVDELGTDVVRLAMLSAAAPETKIGWSGSALRHAERFLEALRDCSGSRLDRGLPDEIDRSSRLRRRLASWCGVAEAKVLGSYERMEIHRACYDLMLFLRRIRDFEERCSEGGRLHPADEDALALALRRLLQLAAPCVPAIAAELEATAGRSMTASPG